MTAMPLIRCSRLYIIIVLALAVLAMLSATLSVTDGHPSLKKLEMPYGSHFLGPLFSNSQSSVEDDVQRLTTLTTIPGGAHVDGFTVLDGLYLRNGTFYILTDDPYRFPSRRSLISRPLDLGSKNMEPTDEDLQFLNISRGHEILGDHAIRIPDFSFIVYDASQFMPHFYHWWGEIIIGAWRVYSKLGDNDNGTTSKLPSPARFILPVVKNGTWRDKAGVNGPLMRAVFPGASIEESSFWDDLAKLNSTFIFDRAMIVSRQTAHRHPWSTRWYKMISGTMSIIPPATFWEPLQKSLIQNMIGYVPRMDERGAITGPPQARTDKPVVTYISRQGSKRKLLPEDHAGLVAALKELEDDGLCEVNVALMERMSLGEQIKLVAKSTIIVGVHGNGLTHQLWMPFSNRSTVIEILYPPGYTFDYEILARNIGHRHYAVHNDTLITYPEGNYHKGVSFPKEFHSDIIPVHGPAIARTIRQRLLDDTPLPRAGVCSADGEQRCL